MPTDIKYDELQNGHGFCARYGNTQIGEIDIIILGPNRLIIERTRIDDEQSVFNRCPEFDDVRLIQMVK